jgi:hypothetical protein
MVLPRLNFWLLGALPPIILLKECCIVLSTASNPWNFRKRGFFLLLFGFLRVSYGDGTFNAEPMEYHFQDGCWAMRLIGGHGE